MHIPIREAMTKNLRWQGVLVYRVCEHAKDNAIAAVRAAVQNGVVGKVLIMVEPSPARQSPRLT